MRGDVGSQGTAEGGGRGAGEQYKDGRLKTRVTEGGIKGIQRRQRQRQRRREVGDEWMTSQCAEKATEQGGSTMRAVVELRRAQKKAPSELERRRWIWRQRKRPRLQGRRGGGRLLTATAGESEGSGAEDKQGGAVARGSATSNVTYMSANKAGARGRRGEISGVTERVAGLRKNTEANSSGLGGKGGRLHAYGVARNPSIVRGEGGGHKDYIVAGKPGGTAREWEGGLSCRRASIPL